MAYPDLINDVFGEQRAVIPEAEFLIILPELLQKTWKQNPKSKWTGEKGARVLVLRYGLAGEKRRTLKEVGEEFGIREEGARQLQVMALRMLRGRPALARYTLEPSNTEDRPLADGHA